MTDTNATSSTLRKVAIGPRMRMRSIKFRNELDRDFHRALRARVQHNFDHEGQSRFGKNANGALALKAAFFIALAAGAYTLILTSGMGPWALLGLANLFGASSLLLAINVAHDAAHHALTALSSAQLGVPDCGLHAARRKCLFVAIAARQIAP